MIESTAHSWVQKNFQSSVVKCTRCSIETKISKLGELESRCYIHYEAERSGYFNELHC